VRPPSEVARAAVRGSVRAPLYVPEAFDSLPNLMKHAAWFGMGGWWLGGVHMRPNPDFMGIVRGAVPADAKVIVACQKGLRSLAAAEQLARAGYGELAWINGGLDTAARGDLEVEGGGPDGADDLRYGGIGGMSEVLGMTDVQKERRRAAAGGAGGGAGGGDYPLLKGALVVLTLDAAWFVWGQVAGK
jgi:rhodanese-related sulfurtransferase